MTPVPLNINIGDFDHALLFCADTDSFMRVPSVWHLSRPFPNFDRYGDAITT